MKKALPLFLALLFLSSFSFSQNNIQFNINHKLGEVGFARGTEAKNNLGHKFNLNRMQYYLSKIAITHDGGQVMALDDVILLIDAVNETSINLGQYAIDQVENLSFYIGVDPSVNHNDPAAFPSGHPLAPQLPSMHWGWVSGYRFVAMEGKSGENLDRTFELHGLGDDYYYQVNIPMTATANNGEVLIELNADYTRTIEDVEVNSGLIVHGDFGEAVVMLANFRDYVFSAASTTSTIDELQGVSHFNAYPNPSPNGVTTIELSAKDQYRIVVSDLLGRKVKSFETTQGAASYELTFDASGIYLLSLVKNGKTLATEKVISTQ